MASVQAQPREAKPIHASRLPPSKEIQALYEREIRKTLGSLYLSLERQFQLHQERLAELSRLSPDWDSYGAEPPSHVAIAASRRILGALRRRAMLPTRILASAEGGVGICFVEGDRYAHIECLNSGDISAVMYQARGDPTVWEIPDDEQSLSKSLEDIRAHFES
ncbi:MAG TPA: hypothetical protein VEU62_05505 [Bryobacterales bacterium]|nr:hypothetical protein [Bryobacterales bacterium]